jgi:hypothetical protein
MLKVKRNDESSGIRRFEILGGRTFAYGVRISQLR